MPHPGRIRVYSSDGKCSESNSSLLMEAEAHLGAFHQTVLRLYGPEEAQKAAEDWIHALESAPPCEEPIRWRQLSLAGADRLATRLAGKEFPGREHTWRTTRRRARQLLQSACPCEAQ